ncbi:MAG TPA: PqqD family protein [Acidimicrobiia bacterium]|nr:PqqD family protein [Acidimicrobiia bacterium]
MPEPTNSISVSPTAVFRPLDDGGVVLDAETGAYFELNSTGCQLWEQLGQGNDLDQIAEWMVRQYDIDPSIARSDLDDFIGELRKRHLIQD